MGNNLMKKENDQYETLLNNIKISVENGTKDLLDLLDYRRTFNFPLLSQYTRNFIGHKNYRKISSTKLSLKFIILFEYLNNSNNKIIKKNIISNSKTNILLINLSLTQYKIRDEISLTNKNEEKAQKMELIKMLIELSINIKKKKGLYFALQYHCDKFKGINLNHQSNKGSILSYLLAKYL